MSQRAPKLIVSRAPGILNNLERWATRDLVRLPFRFVLSLDPLLEFWEEEVAADRNVGLRPVYDRIQQELRQHPHLTGAVEDPARLAEHRELLDLLMMPVFPPAFREQDISAALAPFQNRSFYATAGFERFLVRENGHLTGRVNLDVRTFTYGKVITAYLHILRSIYGVDIPFEIPLVYTAIDPDDGLEKYFKISSDLGFMKIRPVGPTPALSGEQKRRLLSSLADLELWTELIPPDSFEFYGFDIIRAVDVTDVEVVSLLERDLLEGETLLSGEILPSLRQRLRTLLRQPDLEIGLAAYDNGQLFLMHRPVPTCPDCLFTVKRQYARTEYEGSLLDRALRERTVEVVEDLAAYPERTAIEDEMLAAGARNSIAAPLFFQGRSVGVLYLWSREAGALNALNSMKLVNVLPLFSAAVRRGREELRNRVQETILEVYTTIHPSVEWRFRKAALAYIRGREEGVRTEPEPIIFEDVYPLYAATDIRGSSTHRNQAVLADMLEHLAEVDDVLAMATQKKPLPILDYLLSRAAGYRSSLQNGLSSGDEANIRDFLTFEIEPVFEHFRNDPEMQERVRAYYEALDPEHGRAYRRHREFEQSVTLLNRTLSTYLTTEEARAQAAMPHYFEQRQTDGVDFTIYVGASLLESGGEFHDVYVRNLRLWQLMVMCGIARRAAALREQLPVPLETTQLILSQGSPINIRFRFDEAHFDVDGTHDLRFPIMKQRIDKANIKGIDERLTQPGKIAIVYSQAREAWEYEEYIHFLQQSGQLEEGIEDLELSDLQGMVGLRALRVTVALSNSGRTPSVLPDFAERPILIRPEFLEASQN